MTIEIQTSLDQIEIHSSGTIQVRLVKTIINGDIVLSHEWHRYSFVSDVPWDDQLAVLNGSLVSMGFPAVSEADADKIKNIAQHVWP